MRRFLWLIALLAPPALASTIIVSPGVCPHNGAHTGGDADVTGSCSANTSTCGTTSAPCCTLQQGVQRMSANGDVVIMHEGTYTEASPKIDSVLACEANPAGCGVSGTNENFAFFPKAGLSGVAFTGTTLRNAGGDIPILSSAYKNGLLIIRNNTTVSGIQINMTSVNTNDGCQTAAVLMCDVDESAGDGSRGDSTLGISTSGINIHDTVINYTAECSACGSGNIAIEPKSSSYAIIQDNTIEGSFDFAMNPKNNDANTGIIIKHNQIFMTKSVGSSQRGIILERLGTEATGDTTNAMQPGVAVVYNNYFFRTPGSSQATYPFYFREVQWKLYVFNNRSLNGDDWLFTQDDLCTGSPAHFSDEQQWVFNNTATGRSTSAQEMVRWINHYNVNIQGNVFSTVSRCYDVINSGSTQICATRDDSARCIAATCAAGITPSIIDKNVCFNASSVHVYTGGDPDIPDTNTVTGDPKLDVNLRLQAGSSAIGIANPNPLGQGIGNCSISTWNGSIPCNLDFEGNPRGSSWDAGADQFAGASSTCKNGVVELAETCDDGLPNGVHTCVYGDDPSDGLQQVCNGTCSGTTNCSNPTWCGDGIINGPEQADGLNIGSHTCAEFSCTGGTPTAISCAITSIGCTGCPGQADLQGVSLSGVSK